ncbi:MAG: HNH endonuclease [Halioglobus sp.]
MTTKNPNWTRDEHILALELYFRTPAAIGEDTNPDTIELSELLNRIPIHTGAQPGDTFRNPNGVGMKLANFRRFDPGYEGSGLKRGAKLEEEVWNEFADDLAKLHKVAGAIRDNYESLEGPPAIEDEEIDSEEEASEGRVLTRVHKARERNAKIVKRKKAHTLKHTGKLECEACSFDFANIYGELGEGFAECHHKKPVSELQPGEKTKLSDLALLCSNCHRMIHRRRPWLSIDELKALLGPAVA